MTLVGSQRHRKILDDSLLNHSVASLMVDEYVALELAWFMPTCLILSKNCQFLPKCTRPFMNVIKSRLVLIRSTYIDVSDISKVITLSDRRLYVSRC
jgi:hypothetical protein